ncbi:MAG: ParB N-terminal domain-containing protein, partial [Schwartzia sp.]|nr:ParB N-terminal domain-containing protein [Schwartzia sp. (in: firmicutes)]
MKVKEIPISEIKPYANNPRNNAAAVEPVAASIRDFGFRVPIVLDKNGVIVAGHTRLEAAKRLGLSKVPCVVADDLTAEQARAFRIADNKTAELATWDAKKLADEIADISNFNIAEFGFTFDSGKDFFENRERNDKSKQEGNKEYNAFVEKFEEKKTTDDCYTPDEVYDAVADFVADEYKADKKNFVRPFYPGGDYEKFKYPKECVVVDNPPFSILAEIQRFYCENNIKFFLFAPALTIFSARLDTCAICVGADVIYENGACVKTSFVTNLEGLRFKSCPRLYNAVSEANKINVKKQHKQLPKYQYPPNVTTAVMLNQLSLRGVEFEGARDEVAFVRELDEQKEQGKAIFGGGFLI